MCKSQIIESLLKKTLQTVERILANSETITSPSFYLLTPSGMERLESTCMLLIAIGEGVKGVLSRDGLERSNGNEGYNRTSLF